MSKPPKPRRLFKKFFGKGRLLEGGAYSILFPLFHGLTKIRSKFMKKKDKCVLLSLSIVCCFSLISAAFWTQNFWRAAEILAQPHKIRFPQIFLKGKTNQFEMTISHLPE